MRNAQQIARDIVAFVLGKRREIKSVESWDGSAANYEDTSAYCGACLINVNEAAGNTETEAWTQGLCMLPIREPGDGSGVYVDKALFAAAGGRGITAVEKPEGVSDEDWSAAVKSAAKNIVDGYKEMDRIAPAAVYELAGIEIPENDRAMAWQHIAEAVDLALYESGDFWLNNLFTDNDGTTYAVAIKGGQLYRINFQIDGGDVLLGEPIPVEVSHPEVGSPDVGRSATLIIRQADGSIRWIGISSTAILNRSGEIDSTTLHQAFVERFNERDLLEDPVPLDFFHTDVVLGSVDYLARDGFCLIASGLFADNELGMLAAEGVERDPEFWGQSITFLPMAAPALYKVGDGLEFPVWLDGSLERIALLPHKKAAAWFTTMKTRSGAMTDEMFADLVRLVGEEKAREIAGNSGNVNQRVADGGLIARTTETTEATDAGAESDGAEVADEAQDEVPDEVETVEEQEPVEVAATEAQTIRGLRERLDIVEAQAVTMRTALVEVVPELRQRLEVLEASEEARRAAWLSDLPVVTPEPVVRPRQRVPATDDNGGNMTAAQRAAAIVSE